MGAFELAVEVLSPWRCTPEARQAARERQDAVRAELAAQGVTPCKRCEYYQCCCYTPSFEAWLQQEEALQ